MTIRVVTHDDITNDCGLQELVPYPTVIGNAKVVINATTDSEGKVTYTVVGPPDASEVDNGTVFLASILETLAGIANNKAVTPFGLNAVVHELACNAPKANGDQMEKIDGNDRLLACVDCEQVSISIGELFAIFGGGGGGTSTEITGGMYNEISGNLKLFQTNGPDVTIDISEISNVKSGNGVPSTPHSGSGSIPLYVDTSTTPNSLYYWDGSSWNFIGDGAGVGPTNIGYAPSPTDGTITSSTGSDGTVPLVDTTNAGLTPPLSGNSGEYLSGDGSYSTPDGVTDLGYIASPNNGVVTSNTGDNVTIPLADTTNSGLAPPLSGDNSQYLDGDGNYTSISGTIPSGGKTYQTLTKNSNANDDVSWINRGNEQYDNSNSTVIDTTDGVTIFDRTPSANVAYTFSGSPVSGIGYGHTVAVTPSAPITISWPSSVRWPDGTAPSSPDSGERNVYTFYTVDGGVSYDGFLIGEMMI